MVILGLVLLLVGLAVHFLIPDPLAQRIGTFVAVLGAILLLVGIVLLAVDDSSLHGAVLRL